MLDASGNLYGTTSQGGSSNNGTVFEITGLNTKTTVATADPINYTLVNGISAASVVTSFITVPQGHCTTMQMAMLQAQLLR
jgi:uncharacterized repeat protein (TIGR03803 family)